jgi:hypothetical protein
MEISFIRNKCLMIDESCMTFQMDSRDYMHSCITSSRSLFNLVLENLELINSKSDVRYTNKSFYKKIKVVHDIPCQKTTK